MILAPALMPGAPTWPTGPIDAAGSDAGAGVLRIRGDSRGHDHGLREASGNDGQILNAHRNLVGKIIGQGD